MLFESRPAFQKPHEWREDPLAKFKFIKNRRVWELFCVYRDLKWHVYEPLPAALHDSSGALPGICLPMDVTQ